MPVPRCLQRRAGLGRAGRGSDGAGRAGQGWASPAGPPPFLRRRRHRLSRLPWTLRESAAAPVPRAGPVPLHPPAPPASPDLLRPTGGHDPAPLPRGSVVPPGLCGPPGTGCRPRPTVVLSGFPPPPAVPRYRTGALPPPRACQGPGCRRCPVCPAPCLPPPGDLPSPLSPPPLIEPSAPRCPAPAVVPPPDRGPDVPAVPSASASSLPPPRGSLPTRRCPPPRTIPSGSLIAQRGRGRPTRSSAVPSAPWSQLSSLSPSRGCPRCPYRGPDTPPGSRCPPGGPFYPPGVSPAASPLPHPVCRYPTGSAALPTAPPGSPLSPGGSPLPPPSPVARRGPRYPRVPPAPRLAGTWLLSRDTGGGCGRDTDPSPWQQPRHPPPVPALTWDP